MIFDTRIEYDSNRLRARIEKLISRHGVVEVIDRKQRSLSQNNYAHLIMNAMALEIHHTLQYVKEVYFKQWCSPDIFWREETDERTGIKTTYLRSTKDLNIEEMSRTIDNFKAFAAEVDIILPSKDDYEALLRIQIESERNSNNGL